MRLRQVVSLTIRLQFSNKRDHWLIVLLDFPKQYAFRNEYISKCGLSYAFVRFIYIYIYIYIYRIHIFLWGRGCQATQLSYCKCSYSSHGLFLRNAAKPPWCCLPMILFPAGFMFCQSWSLCKACALKLDLQSMPSGDLLGDSVLKQKEGCVRTSEACFKESKEVQVLSSSYPQWSWWLVISSKFCRVIIWVLGLSYLKHPFGIIWFENWRNFCCLCIHAYYLDAGMVHFHIEQL